MNNARHRRIAATLWEWKLRNGAKLRGIPLLSAVFRELKTQLPAGVFSDEELLEAAQKYIDLVKSDYANEPDHEPRTYHEYYSCDVVTAFDCYQGRISENEMFAHSEDSLGPKARENLRTLMYGTSNDAMTEISYA